MFVDASVIVAIVNEESDGEALANRLVAHEGPISVSPLVRYEAVVAIARAAAALARRRTISSDIEKASSVVSRFFDELDLRELTISSEIGQAALEAASHYGKTVGHPADLNLGDCFAYACAKSLKVGLLYKGNDFSQTDLA